MLLRVVLHEPTHRDVVRLRPISFTLMIVG